MLTPFLHHDKDYHYIDTTDAWEIGHVPRQVSKADVTVKPIQRHRNVSLGLVDVQSDPNPLSGTRKQTIIADKRVETVESADIYYNIVATSKHHLTNNKAMRDSAERFQCELLIVSAATAGTVVLAGCGDNCPDGDPESPAATSTGWDGTHTSTPTPTATATAAATATATKTDT